MPKRSDDFQHLVKVIHDAISRVEGATVTESAMLPEPDGTLREVDILLERSVADVPIRLAIECRDRSRKSDVEWIDGLIGKFRNLKVDKIIAVCRRGFSAGAAAKAAASNIELRVLAECLTHEWSSVSGALTPPYPTESQSGMLAPSIKLRWSKHEDGTRTLGSACSCRST